MDGTVADRELSRAASARFAVATPEDDPAIRRMLRDNPIEGLVRLTFEREPNYFRGAGIAGAADQTIVAFSKERLICMGRCSRRSCWLNGQMTEVGYLSELRLDTTMRGRSAYVRGGYRFFHELQRSSPAEFYFTSIAADNGRARRFLEQGIRGMPEYRFLGELVTLLFSSGQTVKPRLHLETATPESLPEMLRVLNDSGKRHQLSAVWTRESVRQLAGRGLPTDRFLFARDGGKMVACGALWDQRSFRQTVIHGYAPTLNAMKPLVNFAARCFGKPRLPQIGSALSHAFLAPFGMVEGAEDLLPDFVDAALAAARKIGVEFLTLALPAEDPRLRALRRLFSARVYRSRLYRVAWPGDASLDAAGRAPFLPDVCFL